MASADAAPHRTDVKPVGLPSAVDECCIVVDGKDQAIALRQELVRRHISCTFPAPTWHRSKYTFRAKAPARGELEVLVKTLAPQAQVSSASSV